MASSDVLTQVGFEKSKIGSGDKEVGYQIKESSLSGLAGSLCLCFLVMGLLVVSMVYDVHFEKKNLHRQVRQVEHHAASKLASVQMELWSQYRDDVHESEEASQTLKALEASYDTFKPMFSTAINDLAKEFNLNQERANKFADRILHLVADMQQDNIKHSKHLLDHLVKAGKKGKKLEGHMDKDMVKMADEEREKVVADGDDEALPAADENDDLKEMLNGFWFTFNDYEKEFGGKVREHMSKGGPVYDSLKTLYDKIRSPTPPTPEEVGKELDAIDLAGIEAPLGSGRTLPAEDIVEELFLVRHIPHEKLAQMEKDWRAGKKDSVTIFSKLKDWHAKNMIPSGWLQMAVDREEKADEEQEEKEKAEAQRKGV